MNVACPLCITGQNLECLFMLHWQWGFFQGGDFCKGRKLVPNIAKELIHGIRRSFTLHDHAVRTVLNETGYPVPERQTVDERAKAHPLDYTPEMQAHPDEIFMAATHG
jgi:hypothetical protein